jgi:hypothetical protein
MNQADHDLAEENRRLSGEGARNLDPTTAERLLAARKVALSRFQIEAAPAWGWAWAARQWVA